MSAKNQPPKRINQPARHKLEGRHHFVPPKETAMHKPPPRPKQDKKAD